MGEPATKQTGQPVPEAYRSEPKIYPREVSGRFASLRKLAVYVLLGWFYLLPWVNWDERQAVLFDLPARKFHLFGLILWPQDFPYLALLLIVAAISLFFFTALAGRLWCGYACPQTVWTEAFIWMEQWTEGRHNKRKKLDAGPWTGEKIMRKSAKQFLWITFALFTGFTFVGYFTPIRELVGSVMTLSLGPWETFWGLFYGFATYGNAGYMREQVCKYMCPYARFQSAMFDKDTLIISYDEERGEPRGKRRRGQDPKAAGLGDCVDCTLCVQVCPTGIDIRKGLQYECIACAACIDACDSVMDKLEYPRGLIRYTTDHAVHGEKIRVIRPRIIIYATLLAVIIGASAFSLFNRTPYIVDVIRDRNAIYRDAGPDHIDNVYTVKILNQLDRERSFALSVSGLDGAALSGVDTEHTVAAGAVLTLPVTVRVPRASLAGVGEVLFEVRALDDSGQSVTEDSSFLGPLPTR